MAASGLCHLFALFLITLSHTSHSSEIPSENAKQSLTRSSTSTADSKPDPDMGPLGDSQQRRHWSCKESNNAGLLSRRPVDRLEYDGTSLDGLSPVRLEMEPGDSMRVEVHDEVRGPAHMRRGNHSPEGEFNRKARRRGHGHLAEHRKQGSKRDKGRAKGDLYDPEPELDSLLKDMNAFEDGLYTSSPNYDNAPLTEDPSRLSPILVTTAIDEHPPTLPPASTKPQVPWRAEASLNMKKSGRGKVQGEVMPTLDMTLFDWTDYEDMKPADTWPSNKRKDKRRSKNKSNGNTTLDSEVIEPCDHHLDCLPGSCCDLREHECKPHNHGLNNKCYDDCMCEEGGAAHGSDRLCPYVTEDFAKRGSSRLSASIRRGQDPSFYASLTYSFQLARLTSLLEELASSVQSWSPQSSSTAANQAQTPAAPVPPQPSVSTACSNSSTPFPEKFNGSPEACEGFLQQCSWYISHQPQFYGSDTDRISFICSLLTGKALEWAGAFWEPGRMSFPSFDVFTALFRKAFELPAEKEGPEELLFSLRRGGPSEELLSISFLPNPLIMSDPSSPYPALALLKVLFLRQRRCRGSNRSLSACQPIRVSQVPS
ncbi:draxin [Pimephales promelas]|nr:draxin [Pimephales promelas]